MRYLVSAAMLAVALPLYAEDPAPVSMFYGPRQGDAFELIHEPWEDDGAPALKVRLVPDGKGGYTEEPWEADGEGGWARVAGASLTRR